MVSQLTCHGSPMLEALEDASFSKSGTGCWRIAILRRPLVHVGQATRVMHGGSAKRALSQHGLALRDPSSPGPLLNFNAD